MTTGALLRCCPASVSYSKRLRALRRAIFGNDAAYGFCMHDLLLMCTHRSHAAANAAVDGCECYKYSSFTQSLH